MGAIMSRAIADGQHRKSKLEIDERLGGKCKSVPSVMVEHSVGCQTLSMSTQLPEPVSDLTAIFAAPIAGTGSTHPRRSRRKTVSTELKTSALFSRYEREVSISHATSSCRREQMAFRSLTRLLGHLDANRLGPHEAYTYRRTRETESIAAGTVDYELRLLQQVFSTARVLWEPAYSALPVPVVPGVKPRLASRPGVALGEPEITRLLTACAPELASVVTVALETGLRISELVALTASQIDFDKGLITIEQQKNGKRSVLPLAQKALRALKEGATRPEGRLFLRRNGQAWTDRLLREHFQAAVKSAGLPPCRFHDLRHTFATRLLERGVSMHAVQQLGRWSSVVMLQRYGHYDVEHLREALDAGK